MSWRRLGLASCLVLAALLLSGCFQSAIDIRFDSQTHGLVRQQIQLADRFTQLSARQVQPWFDQVAHQVRTLGGSVRQPTPQTWQLEVPFNNGAELVEKFNHLMTVETTGLLSEMLGTTQVRSQLSLKQNNWILALRNQLTWDLDLRSVKAGQPTGGVFANLQPLSLQFSLTTPWGIRQIVTSPATSWQNGQTLQLGQLNHLEAIFWVPSPIGIGAVAIAALVSLGWLVRDRLSQFP
ncbi:DUF3153 domain-containing protein [Almyronema epifaneia]|uniref:DUF3153 domain-containing protein n=1 Tax=Almyronema epifaneia S1 TaxID=2991925 RepID=A0ABW6IHF7_9CYAN